MFHHFLGGMTILCSLFFLFVLDHAMTCSDVNMIWTLMFIGPFLRWCYMLHVKVSFSIGFFFLRLN